MPCVAVFCTKPSCTHSQISESVNWRQYGYFDSCSLICCANSFNWASYVYATLDIFETDDSTSCGTSECMADALKLQSWQERISACILKYIGKNIHSSLVAAYRTKEEWETIKPGYSCTDSINIEWTTSPYKKKKMLCKVTHCAGCILANTRPHQLCWGDPLSRAQNACSHAGDCHACRGLL